MIIIRSFVLLIMYGYIDESGEPGKAKNNSDYLSVVIILFEKLEDARKCSEEIEDFKNRNNVLDYELHHSENPKWLRKKFIEFIPGLDFKYIVVSIRKDNRKQTTYYELAVALIARLSVYCGECKIEMDTNPILRKQLCLVANSSKFKFKERRSSGNNLIQLADYIVAVHTRKLKGKIKKVHRGILRKMVNK